MANSVNATCTACNGAIQLSQAELDQLGRSEPVACSQCQAMVKIKTDPGSERRTKLSVLTLTTGAAIVAIVALINLFGDAGFPTYFVAIPFILISTLVVSVLNKNTLNLESAE